VAGGFATVVFGAVAGCTPGAAPEPHLLRFSAIPDQSPDNVRAQHVPMMDLVCGMAKVRCVWVPVPSYEALVDRVGRGEIDVAYFGGVTFAQAQHRYGVEPLAMRDIDAHFTTVVLVRAEDAAQNLDDLRGRAFAFGPRSSTSGHVMARDRLERAGFVAERDFSQVEYSTGHDATMRMIAEGKVAAGAVNGSIAYGNLAHGLPDSAQLRVLWRSPPYVDYVWGARKELPAVLRERLRDAFLDLSPSDAAHRLALEREAAAGYVPAFVRDFSQVASVLARMGML
jgi:phosphonate transport system substrate-binding protein